MSARPIHQLPYEEPEEEEQEHAQGYAPQAIVPSRQPRMPLRPIPRRRGWFQGRTIEDGYAEKALEEWLEARHVAYLEELSNSANVKGAQSCVEAGDHFQSLVDERDPRSLGGKLAVELASLAAPAMVDAHQQFSSRLTARFIEKI